MKKLDIHGYITLGMIVIIGFFGWRFYTQLNNNPGQSSTENQTIKFTKPDYIRGLYLTAHSAGQDDWRQNLISKMKAGRLNAVVIDIKDYSGYILYDTQIPEIKNISGTNIQMTDVKKIIQEFHDADIYVIARQTVFQDPVLGEARPELAFHTKNGNIWKDKNNLAWLDPSQQGVWEYNLAIAKEALALGFDEIQFDYMRYPSDGNLASLQYNIPEDKTRSQVLGEFFKYLADNLAEAEISVDLFGLVTDNTNSEYDLGIGQRLTVAADHFDYISPMMYPSHYADGYLGLANPAANPGPVIAYGLKVSHDLMQTKASKLRPWIQAFSIGANYDKQKIDAQISAVENVTSTEGWLLWNARNVYPDYIFE